MEINGSGEMFVDGKSIGHVDGLTLLVRSLEKFNDACAAAVYEWPDEVIEDVLDADVIG